MSPQGQPELIDRDYVRLLMVMRRFIREEFNHKISINEEDAAVKLLDYAERSRNRVLQEMGKELRGMLTPVGDDLAATQDKSAPQQVHYYRGVAQPVAAEPPATIGATPQPGRATRIYRGRVVAG